MRHGSADARERVASDIGGERVRANLFGTKYRLLENADRPDPRIPINVRRFPIPDRQAAKRN